MVTPHELRGSLISEILTTFREYFKNADQLVNEYVGFPCKEHQDKKPFKLERIHDTFVNGWGYTHGGKWLYNLYTPILWKFKCECGYEIDIGFLIHYSTQEWDEIKQKLSDEPLSKNNMIYRQLGKYSNYEFFDGIFSFEKRK